MNETRSPISGLTALLLLVVVDGVALHLLISDERALLERSATIGPGSNVSYTVSPSGHEQILRNGLFALVALPMVNLLAFVLLPLARCKSGRKRTHVFRAGFALFGVAGLLLFVLASVNDSGAIYKIALGALGLLVEPSSHQWAFNSGRPFRNLAVAAVMPWFLLLFALLGGWIARTLARPSSLPERSA